MKDSKENNSDNTFDFLFIGLGAANCLLILRLNENFLLKGKKIAIIEPESKTTNDRTFCFWATMAECAQLKLTSLVSNSWENILVSGTSKQEINPLYYFHIKGIDLYDATKSALRHTDVTNFTTRLSSNPQFNSSLYEINLENKTFFARKVFDSRPPSFLPLKKQQSHLLQSFYGLQIKTTTKVFDTSTVLMMDFNIPQNNFTQFMYILPFAEDTALIELTRFGTEKLDILEAKKILETYIKEKGISFTILEEEKGVISMSSAKIEIDDFGENWIKMGSRADMLKPTSGYAFHSMAEDAFIQMEAIKNDYLPKRKTRKQRFIFYDRLLLKILQEKPEYGKIIFETLFHKVPVPKVLSFLREGTKISEEIVILSKLPKRLFIKAAFKDFITRITLLPVLWMPFFLTILMLFLISNKLDYLAWSVLAIGFLSVGLSHGALDHVISEKIINKRQLLNFTAGYLLKSALLGFVWFLFPDLALLLFIVYSAWHFGQADFKEWTLKHGFSSFFWGLCVLMVILFFHFDELNWILQQIPNLKIDGIIKQISEVQLKYIQLFSVVFGVVLAAMTKSKHILFTLTYLLISSMLPLLISFGIYFIAQHSIHGWRHLLVGLNEKTSSLWLKSLPFSIGGALLILLIPLFAGPKSIGVFFILLSCLSIPHVFSMHRFYSKYFQNK